MDPMGYKDLVHHPIDPTIYKQMGSHQVLGTNTQQGGPAFCRSLYMELSYNYITLLNTRKYMGFTGVKFHPTFWGLVHSMYNWLGGQP